MNRQLLLVSNPGNPNDNNYVRTIETAIDRDAKGLVMKSEGIGILLAID